VPLVAPGGHNGVEEESGQLSQGVGRDLVDEKRALGQEGLGQVRLLLPEGDDVVSRPLAVRR